MPLDERVVRFCLQDLISPVTAKPVEHELSIEELGQRFQEYQQTIGAQAGSLITFEDPDFASLLADFHKPIAPETDLIALLDESLADLTDFERKALKPLLFLTVSLLKELFRSAQPPLAMSHCSSGSSYASLDLVCSSSLSGEGEGGICISASKSTLPVGSGLGSSAAFCVATAAALLEAKRSENGGAVRTTDSPQEIGNRPVAREEAEIVNRWAFAAEVLMHGHPSGLDNSMSVFGGALRFVKEPLQIDQIEKFPEIRLLLTNTKVERSTKQLVGNVRRLYERLPGVVKGIWSAIEAVSQSCLESISAKEKENGADEFEERMEELIRINQSLLRAVGVSHSSIEQVCEITAKWDITTKLTGAGEHFDGSTERVDRLKWMI